MVCLQRDEAPNDPAPGTDECNSDAPAGFGAAVWSAINLFVPEKLQTDFNHEWTIDTNERKAEASGKTGRAPSAVQYGIERSSVIRVNCPFVVHRQGRRIPWPNAPYRRCPATGWFGLGKIHGGKAGPTTEIPERQRRNQCGKYSLTA
jgi:hypothetical protein